LGVALVLAPVLLLLGWFSEKLPSQSGRYYGIVVDEQGVPMANVAVYGPKYTNSLFGDTCVLTNYEGLTGPDGLFSITDLLRHNPHVINLNKEGYDSDGAKGGVYPTFDLESGPQTPTRFVMRKQRGPEPSIKHVLELELPYDGSETRVNFLTGQVTKGESDLIIRLKTPPFSEEDKNYKRPWDWDLEFLAEGGLAPSPRRLMNEAPEKGYVAKLNLGRKKGPAWWGQAQGNYYVFSRGKLYSKLTLYFTGNPYFGNGSLSINWQTNPTGSRNLEYDEAKDVTKEYLDRK
jgi:hypothetical protein